MFPASPDPLTVQELKALEQAVKVRLAPRARFAFAKANKSSPTTVVPHPTPVDSSPATAAPSALPILSTSAATTVQGRRGEYLVRSDLALPSYPTELGSLVLSDLTDTCVNLLHSIGHDDGSLAGMNQIADDSRSFSAIHITNLIDCVVVLPSSSTGSIMVHNCDGCTFVVGAQQVRHSQLGPHSLIELVNSSECTMQGSASSCSRLDHLPSSSAARESRLLGTAP